MHVHVYMYCTHNFKFISLSFPAMYEPLGGVFIGSGDSKTKPALFIVSCGEGHLDLRTADKVLQTLQAKETGQTGLPSPASILSDKNYIMVWDINSI